jgi:hypothetical protein
MISSLQLGRLNHVHIELSEVVTGIDDVRYCEKSGLTADVEFSAESDPEPKSVRVQPRQLRMARFDVDAADRSKMRHYRLGEQRGCRHANQCEAASNRRSSLALCITTPPPYSALRSRRACRV